jgi:hypothetical protein
MQQQHQEQPLALPDDDVMMIDDHGTTTAATTVHGRTDSGLNYADFLACLGDDDSAVNEHGRGGTSIDSTIREVSPSLKSNGSNVKSRDLITLEDQTSSSDSDEEEDEDEDEDEDDDDDDYDYDYDDDNDNK